MSTITSQTFQPGLSAGSMPRGARAAAAAFVAGWRLLSALFSGVRVDSRTRDASYVRALARDVQRTDPGFAADLYAAAARHEGKMD